MKALTGLSGLSGLIGAPAAPPPVAPSLSNPSFIYQNTTYTNDLSADGYSWANALPEVKKKT